MIENRVRKLTTLGQSVWLDFIEREFIRSGELSTLIREDGVSGVTSNPAIFQKAFTEPGYRQQIVSLVRGRKSVEDIYEALVIEDIRAAADALREVFERTQGQDGFVSLEVSPHLARDSDATFEEGKRLWAAVDRPNLMIKVPGTQEGVDAIRRLTEAGIHVNVTLLFGVARYAEVAAAYEQGIRARVDRGQPVDRILSVASFFVSRIDSLIDAKLDALGTTEAAAARGRYGVASARAAYAQHLEMIHAPAWRALEARGAHPQKLLWASTGVKDPAYPDTKYVDELVYPNTITTVPPETLAAYRDHGTAVAKPFDAAELGRDHEQLSKVLGTIQLDWRKVSDQLEQDGIEKFVKPFQAMFASLQEQVKNASRA
jgi:transaldolase